MPLDEIVTQSPLPEGQYWLKRVSDWHLDFVFKPKTCSLTGRRIWLEYCYKGTMTFTGPGEPRVQCYYIDKDEFLIWNLSR